MAWLSAFLRHEHEAAPVSRGGSDGEAGRHERRRDPVPREQGSCDLHVGHRDLDREKSGAVAPGEKARDLVEMGGARRLVEEESCGTEVDLDGIGGIDGIDLDGIGGIGGLDLDRIGGLDLGGIGGLGGIDLGEAAGDRA
ncbi:MAG: hypothetical protein FJ144_26325 [Deltaproteobacteria bacterium]|nr:hypothetical protein [Deltaproteobacteria bacterium]